MAFLSIAGLGKAADQVGTFAEQLGNALTPPIAVGLVALAVVGLGTLVSARATPAPRGSWGRPAG